ncbi:hypothetical protein AAMO2058_000220300 [Amorphochlora amoebiformis]
MSRGYTTSFKERDHHQSTHLPFSQVLSQAFYSDRSPSRHTPSGWRPSQGSMVNMYMHTPFNVHGFEEIRPTPTSILVCDETPGHCPPMPANLLESPESWNAFTAPCHDLNHHSTRVKPFKDASAARQRDSYPSRDTHLARNKPACKTDILRRFPPDESPP